MKVSIPARSGELTVETTSGTWTQVQTRISYKPDQDVIGESAVSLPPLCPEDLQDLIRLLEFVVERGDRA